MDEWTIATMFSHLTLDDRYTGPSKSIFLSLPAELRNMIYDFAVEDDTKMIVLRPPRRPRQLRCNDCLMHLPPPPTVLRSFYSLTQVCRQIRSEYNPLYRARTRVHVHIEDIHEYVRTLINMSNGKGDNLVGKLIMRGNSCVAPFMGSYFDLTPLINTAKAAPRLSISCDWTHCARISGGTQLLNSDTMDALLDSTVLPKLSRFLEESVSRVAVELDGGINLIHIYLKEGSDLPMSDNRFGIMDEWQDQVGLQVKERWLVFHIA
ncbi:hypothetical protein NX059_012012 [Plenodomus lindquistii]|nr:hypothetical protein NX059_012012 [Plenodomus lindquistii]